MVSVRRQAGQYLIGDTLCDDFIRTPIKFLDTFIEWGVDRTGYIDTYYALPDDAKFDPKARCYLRTNRNSVEEAAEIVGLINDVFCGAYFQGVARVPRCSGNQRLA